MGDAAGTYMGVTSRWLLVLECSQELITGLNQTR